MAFVLDGDPVPKGRPRVVNGHTYTDARTVNAERQFRAAALKAGAKPSPLPVLLTVSFWRQTARRCDVDNLAKTVLDSLNGVAWVDDAQVITLHATKGIDRENPRTEVTVTYCPTEVAETDWEQAWDNNGRAP